MKKVCLFLTLLCLAAGCETSGGIRSSDAELRVSAFEGTIKPGTWVTDKISYKWNGKEGAAAVQVFFPRGYVKGKDTRTLVVLHGYRQSMKDWQTNTSIASLANQYGMAVVCPSTGTTVYESEYFPETVSEWAPVPGGIFIPSVLMPWLEKRYSLGTEKALTGIMGNSTGGRGAILAAERNPELFCAAAGASGDYDPESIPQNRILAAVYGPCSDFPDRWKNTDNPMKMADRLSSVPVYICHGTKDTVVPLQQSLVFAIKMKQLKKADSSYSVRYEEFSYGLHNWDFWKKALPEMMRFFDQHMEKAD